ncbi:MAG: acetyl-CoA carboxylase biotin carboxyl carrier protein [Pirellulales bacterium]
MSSSSSGQGDVFDVRKIRKLVELMNEHDLAEIDLRQADQRIRLRRGPDPAYPHLVAPAPMGVAPAAAPPSSQPGSAAPSAAAAETQSAHITNITSPMVGTFYTSSSPEAEPFVKMGDHVGPDSTVCIIEAMKVFNEIPAECSGQIVAILVENGEPVEFGQPMFKVDTSK